MYPSGRQTDAFGRRVRRRSERVFVGICDGQLVTAIPRSTREVGVRCSFRRCIKLNLREKCTLLNLFACVFLLFMFAVLSDVFCCTRPIWKMPRQSKGFSSKKKKAYNQTQRTAIPAGRTAGKRLTTSGKRPQKKQRVEAASSPGK